VAGVSPTCSQSTAAGSLAEHYLSLALRFYSALSSPSLLFSLS
jgi:hypothetical protein